MNGPLLTRRHLLAGACSLAAAPLFTPASFAAVPSENRFVTIVLRGALDGLYLLQPHGAPELKALRPDFALAPGAGLIDFDGFYGLHDKAAPLMEMMKAGELAFVQAVATPYRNVRSHFDGQDVLESGARAAAEIKTGWLNRALALIPRSQGARAIDVNSSAELILSGPNPVDVWGSRSDLAVSADDAAFLERLYAGDPAFAKALADAMIADQGADQVFGSDRRTDQVEDMARLTAGMLKGAYRIASFSVSGWDTHVGQDKVFQKPLKGLVSALTILKAELGPEIWEKTTVLAMTEFGRTARQNGSKGTDHGTGGLAILAGGAIAGGKVFGDFPGLKDDQLYENRDLMPKTDVRDIAAQILAARYGLSAGDITNQLFPGLAMGPRPAWLG